MPSGCDIIAKNKLGENIMSDFKFDYNISESYDRDAYEKVIARLDAHVPPLEKGECIREDDGSEMQFYRLEGKKLAVHIVDFLDLVYVTSEFDAEEYLK